jgi:ABC-2 type transport system ATP-binding protein
MTHSLPQSDRLQPVQESSRRVASRTPPLGVGAVPGATADWRTPKSNGGGRRLLVIEGLRKNYGPVTALAGVDLDIEPGEVLALLGPNGAGKTTLVSVVAGLLRPDAGHVEVDGIDVQAHPGQARRRLGLAPQETGVYPTLSVYDNLRFYGELEGLRRKVLRRRIEEVADALALSELVGRQARALSGGEARRLHTAMVLMHRPALLLLDEPTTGVDVSTRAKLLAVVRQLAAEGSSICYSTHYLAEVEQLGASVAILDDGRVVARGPLDELVSAHGQAAVELHFDGVPPALAGVATEQIDDSTVRIPTERPPAIEAAAALGRLGDAAQRLRSVELIQPSLESVFLALTGRRFTIDRTRDGEHVTAP